MNPCLWQVAVNAPLPSTLTYSSSLPVELQIGQSVKVPLGKRTVDGVILDHGKDDGGKFQLKDILEIHPERPALNSSQLNWLRWLARYYQYPIGRVAQLFFPPLKKHSQRASRKAPVIPEQPESSPLPLTNEQSQVFADISGYQDFSVHLLFGVTGSGKTEVYLRLLEEVIARGQKGLVLVPEISLTPQLISRFSARFGPRVAAIHSQLTEREKTNQWWSMVDGEKDILIGARSALFCPIENIGLIILDEEHEASFKQEEKLKYHARDAAIVLAREVNCPVVLGSATPSLESWQNVQEGKYSLHEMSRRVQDRALPEIHMIDLKKENADPQDAHTESSQDDDLPFWLSRPLFEALQKNYQAGAQAALFLNRRGVAQSVTCPACGHTSECPNCAVSLTLHGRSHLVCHYCGYHENKTEICPECHEGEPTAFGLGTELIETELQRLFPQARVARADRDEIQSREQLEELILRMENKEIDFLVGTQMIAKGLDFPHLKLVGLVLADVGLHLPDFRSSERIFQLVTQMSGRAGRHIQVGEDPGQVFVQTFNPEHPGLRKALAQDYRGFAEEELNFRRELGYPPFGRMASLRIQGSVLSETEKTAQRLANMAQQLQTKHESYRDLALLGPVEAPLSKLRGQYRFHCLIKAPQAQMLTRFSQHLTQNLDWLPSKTRVIVDIDPVQLL